MEMIASPRTSISVPVTETTQIGEARRTAAGLCKQLKLSEVLSGKIGIVVSELATNLSKHTPGGEIVLRSLGEWEGTGIEVISLDKGPGFDVEKCLRDGYSSRGTSGTGLGSIQRLSELFEVFSQVGSGTIIVAHLREKTPSSPNGFEFGVICLPIKGETACGDSWSVARSGYHYRFLLTDGLGHGILAAEASDAAVRVFHERSSLGPVQLMESIHLALRPTRGAAVAIAEIDVDRLLANYVGVGNIAGQIFEPVARRNLISHNGTAGAEMSRVAPYSCPWTNDSLLIMNSDGLTNRWKLEDYRGLQAQHPAVVAAVLYRDFRRGRDDVTVLVARERSGR